MNIFRMIKNRKKVLGMNERNLKYIRPYNLENAKEIVDDKLLTKTALEKAGIPTPALIAEIHDNEQFRNFDWDSLPKSFVMKPVSGLEGSGIEIFYNRDRNGDWIKSDGTKISINELKMKALDIMDGKYSLHNQKDSVFFEERVKMHKIFKYYAYKGAPDVRIIVFNNIPIMSYVRLPTKASQGKGNLAQGAIGAAIDIVTGTTTNAIIGKSQAIETIPGTKLSVSGLRIPYWNTILKIAIEAQRATKLGYAAIDFLIDRERGPVIIELNARPGLSIQLSNRDGLRWRLKKAAGIKVTTVSKGVRVAKDLFGGQLEEEIEKISGKEIISHIEPVEIFSEKGSSKTLALIDTSRRTSTITEKLAKKLEIIPQEMELIDDEASVSDITFNLGGNMITTDCRVVKSPIRGYKFLVGRKDLGAFLIDIRRVAVGDEAQQRKALLTSQPYTDNEKVDETLSEINKRISIIKNVIPRNRIQEKKKFNKSNSYNPVYKYNAINLDTDSLIQKLSLLNPDPATKIGKLFIDDIEYLKKEIYLLEAIGDDDNFPKRSIALYGEPDQEIFDQAVKFVKENTFTKSESKEKILKESEVKEILRKSLDNIGFTGQIVFSAKGPNKASVNKRGNSININKNYKFTESKLRGTIAHEIDVHLFRAIQGAKQPYKIFSYGTANYIETEEGLAVFNKAKVLENNQPIRNAALMYIAAFLNAKQSYRETYNNLLDLGLTEQNAYRFTYRSKRGIQDTSKSGAYLKDLLYYRGYLKVSAMSDAYREKLLKNGKTHEVIEI